jgi:AcrR family transcriptional regulator
LTQLSAFKNPMAKSSDDTTRTKLLNAAEKVFAELGFQGASVRTINAEAKVDSGAIHYHFGTKHDLFREVISRRGAILSGDRLQRLARCTLTPGSHDSVEQIVAAYILPYLNPALGSHDDRARFARLRARMVAEQTSGDAAPLGAEHKQTAQTFIDALAAVLPQIPRGDLAERFLIMWSSLNTLSAGLGHVALGLPEASDPLAGFERSMPKLIRLFAVMFAAPSTTGDDKSWQHQRSTKARSTT